jgi:hypothetical protein
LTQHLHLAALEVSKPISAKKNGLFTIFIKDFENVVGTVTPDDKY